MWTDGDASDIFFNRPFSSSTASQYSPSVPPSPRLETSEPTQTSQIGTDLEQKMEAFEWLQEKNFDDQDQIVEVLDAYAVSTHSPCYSVVPYKPSIVQHVDGGDWSAVRSDHKPGACVVPDFISQSAFATSECELALQPSNQTSSRSTMPAPPNSAAALLAMLTDDMDLGGLSCDMIGAWDPDSRLTTPMKPQNFQPYSRTDGRNMPASSGEHRDSSSVEGLSDECCASPLSHRVT